MPGPAVECECLLMLFRLHADVKPVDVLFGLDGGRLSFFFFFAWPGLVEPGHGEGQQDKRDDTGSSSSSSSISRPLAFSRFRFMRLSGFSVALNGISGTDTGQGPATAHAPPLLYCQDTLHTFINAWHRTESPVMAMVRSQLPTLDALQAFLLKNAIQHDLHFRCHGPGPTISIVSIRDIYLYSGYARDGVQSLKYSNKKCELFQIIVCLFFWASI